MKKYFWITIGTLLFAIGINFFLEPNHIASGGVSGIAIILRQFLSVDLGTLIFLMNIPLLMIGTMKLGYKEMIGTFYAIFMSSFITNLLQGMEPLTDDLLLGALGGSVFVATGIGMVFKVGATTGGTDIVVQLLKLRYPHLRTGFLFYVVDFAIVCTSGIVFGNIEIAMYAAISVIANSFIMDFVLYGKDEAKLIYVISNQSTEIAQAFLEELEIGVTYMKGIGGYHKTEKEIIMCVMRKAVYPKAEEMIRNIDGTSFIIVTSATEIYGEGYKNLFAKKL
ncbi:MAG: YitT family protein [Eubacteriales bacterium]